MTSVPPALAGVEDVAAVELGGDVALGQLPGQDVGRLGVVVGQGVAGAAAEGGGPEGDRAAGGPGRRAP